MELTLAVAVLGAVEQVCDAFQQRIVSCAFIFLLFHCFQLLVRELYRQKENSTNMGVNRSGLKLNPNQACLAA